MNIQYNALKKCKKCGRDLPRNETHFFIDNRTGKYYAPCKDCKAKRRVVRRAVRS